MSIQLKSVIIRVALQLISFIVFILSTMNEIMESYDGVGDEINISCHQEVRTFFFFEIVKTNKISFNLYFYNNFR